jgi:phosphoglycolate phosphatase
MIQAVVFDFDGTLVNSNSLKRDGFKSVIKNNNGNLQLIEKICDSNFGNREDIFIEYESCIRGCAVNANDLAVKRLVSEYSNIIDLQVIQSDEMPGASMLMKQIFLSHKYLILSSSTPQENLNKILKARSWFDYFDYISGSQNSKINTLRYICANFMLKANELAVVGDGLDDRESALAIGAQFFPVGEARGLRSDEKKYSFIDLLQILSN